MRPLLCLGRCRLRSGLFRLGLLGGRITQRGGLVLLGLAFLRQRFVAAYGPGRFLSSTLHVFHDAFDPASGPDSFAIIVSRCSMSVPLAPPWALPATVIGAPTQRTRPRRQAARRVEHGLDPSRSRA